MDPDARLPIKIVMPRESEFQPPDGGGGPAKVFGDVTAEVREALDYQVGEVEQHFRETFQRTSLPAVARVALKPKALAKSHRPTDLLNERTCPIIGVGGFGELYVSARPRGLQGLSHRIQHLNTKRGIANISTISEILPYTPEEVLGPPDPGLKLEVATCEAAPKGMMVCGGGKAVFAHVTKGVIECPGCGNANFQASLRAGEAVLSCTKCGQELRG